MPRTDSTAGFARRDIRIDDASAFMLCASCKPAWASSQLALTSEQIARAISELAPTICAMALTIRAIALTNPRIARANCELALTTCGIARAISQFALMNAAFTLQYPSNETRKAQEAIQTPAFFALIFVFRFALYRFLPSTRQVTHSRRRWHSHHAVC
jgi:hypothetical protein